MLYDNYIPYFHIFTPPENKSRSAYQPGMIISLQYESQYKALVDHPFLYIPSRQLAIYEMRLWRCYRKEETSFPDEDFWDKVEYGKAFGDSLTQSFNSFQFLEVVPEMNDERFIATVKAVFDPLNIFDYWKSQNIITDDRFFQLGIVPSVFDTVPAGYHYFDFSYICTCGDPGCDLLFALLVKDEDGNCYVPFMIDKNRSIHFNLIQLNQEYSASDPPINETIAHADLEKDTELKYRVYPYYLSSKDFIINPYTLKPNE